MRKSEAKRENIEKENKELEKGEARGDITGNGTSTLGKGGNVSGDRAAGPGRCKDSINEQWRAGQRD